MAPLVYKWLLLFVLSSANPAVKEAIEMLHPFFVSVTSIEHNQKDKTLEISCKLFTDDFEKTLRKHYSSKIDLLDVKQKKFMEPVVDAYIQKHLSIKTDGKVDSLHFLGFEQDGDGIVSYYQVNDIATVKKIEVSNNLLYEYAEQQTGIIHVTVKGVRKSTKLVNPDSIAVIEFSPD